jgi:hypothetical protein
MLCGLNGDLDATLYEAVRGFGFGLSRCETWGSAETARASGLAPLLLIRDLAMLDARAANLDVEWQNEPDGSASWIDPVDYAAQVPPFLDACARVGARPWIGAISNLHRDALKWLRKMWAALPGPLSPEVGVTSHRYHAPYPCDVWTPHEGFASRDDEVAALLGIIGDRPWAISEFGYHTAPQLKKTWLPKWWPGNSWRWTDVQVAGNVAQEWVYWRERGAVFAVLYQINDGPTDTREDRYGIRYYNEVDPFDWKAVAYTLPVVSTLLHAARTSGAPDRMIAT